MDTKNRSWGTLDATDWWGLLQLDSRAFLTRQILWCHVAMPRLKTIGRTMKAAHQLQLAGCDEMAMAVELIDVHTPNDQELSLTARRSLLLMLEAAAGDAWKPQVHRIPKKALRGNRNDMGRVRSALDELMGVWFSHAAMLGGRRGKKRFHLFKSISDQDSEQSSAFVEYTFDDDARALLERSEVYARLSREAIIKYQGRYSLRMYELGASIYMRRDITIIWDVMELRRFLHMPDNIYPNFADFRKRVLEPSQLELGQLAEFDFTWEEIRSGREVKRLRMTFTPKPGRRALAAAEENTRHSAGRIARRDGTVEEVVDVAAVVDGTAVKDVIRGATKRLTKQAATHDLTWPQDDDIVDYVKSTAELHAIAVEHGAGHSVRRLADAYAKHMGPKRFQLNGDRLRSSWLGFVQDKARNWKAV